MDFVALDKVPIARLKSIARYHAISLQGCAEKEELVAALRAGGVPNEVPKEEPKPRPAPPKAAAPAPPPSQEDSAAPAEEPAKPRKRRRLSKAKLESLGRATLKQRVFALWDEDGDGALKPNELLKLANCSGFDGDEEEWPEMYEELCSEQGCAPASGMTEAAFMKLLDDDSDGGCFLSDKELVDVVKEAQDKEMGDAEEDDEEDRGDLKKRVFILWDKDEDKYLKKEEMLIMARHVGFDGDEEDWEEEYGAICGERGCSQASGVSEAVVMTLLDDKSETGCFFTDGELAEILAGKQPPPLPVVKMFELTDDETGAFKKEELMKLAVEVGFLGSEDDWCEEFAKAFSDKGLAVGKPVKERIVMEVSQAALKTLTSKPEEEAKKDGDAEDKNGATEKKDGDAEKKDGDGDKKEGDGEKKEGDAEKKGGDGEKKDGDSAKKENGTAAAANERPVGPVDLRFVHTARWRQRAGLATKDDAKGKPAGGTAAPSTGPSGGGSKAAGDNKTSSSDPKPAPKPAANGSVPPSTAGVKRPADVSTSQPPKVAKTMIPPTVKPAAPPPKAILRRCEACEKVPADLAVVQCLNCEAFLCAACDEDNHNTKLLKTHERKPIEVVPVAKNRWGRHASTESSPPATPPTPKLDELPVAKLKLLAKNFDVSILGCSEKQEIVQALRSAKVPEEAAEALKEKEEAAKAAPPPASSPPPAGNAQADAAAAAAKAREAAAKREAAAREAAAREAAARKPPPDPKDLADPYGKYRSSFVVGGFWELLTNVALWRREWGWEKFHGINATGGRGRPNIIEIVQCGEKRLRVRGGPGIKWMTGWLDVAMVVDKETGELLMRPTNAPEPPKPRPKPAPPTVNDVD